MFANTKADVTPMKPKKGALVGQVSVDMVFPLASYLRGTSVGSCDSFGKRDVRMCALRLRRRRCGFDGLAAAARGARGQRVRLSGLAPKVTAASALARMTANYNLRHGYRT